MRLQAGDITPMPQLVSQDDIMRVAHEVILGVFYLLILLMAFCLAQALRRVGLMAMLFINGSLTSSCLIVTHIHSQTA